MHYHNSFVALALSLPLVAYSKTLYTDGSCTSKPGWDDYWKETQNLAKRSGERMDSATDTDFEAVFKRIFQTEKGSTEGQYARGILKEIVDLTTAPDLKSADIRLFCDNDKRWGNQRPTGGWYDKTNEMVTKNEPSCNKALVLGRCYERKAKPPADANSPRAGHNVNRVGVTICDETFAGSGGLPLMITDEVKNEDLQDSLVNYLSLMVSHTMLHELAHAVSISEGKFAIQDLPDKDHAYGWDNVITKDGATAVKNADNYAFLGLWAVLGDLGYTLARVNEPGLSEDDKKEREDDAVKGYINKYLDITKRMLMPLVAMTWSA